MFFFRLKDFLSLKVKVSISAYFLTFQKAYILLSIF
jgi:hypothetical protein